MGAQLAGVFGGQSGALSRCLPFLGATWLPSALQGPAAGEGGERQDDADPGAALENLKEGYIPENGTPTPLPLGPLSAYTTSVHLCPPLQLPGLGSYLQTSLHALDHSSSANH